MVPPSNESRETKSIQTRQHIFDTALDLFCEVGYKETTLIDIAKTANVSTRTLHRYFPTKGSILKYFCKENILSLKRFADELPSSLSTREKVETVLLQDFKFMFCLFDTTYIMHLARDDHGIFDRSEIDNIFETESIYQKVFVREQVNRGITPNSNTVVCASTIMAIYRHCADVYRFQTKGEFVEDDLRKLLSVHLDIVWQGIEKTLTSDKLALDTPGIRAAFNVSSSLLDSEPTQ